MKLKRGHFIPSAKSRVHTIYHKITPPRLLNAHKLFTFSSTFPTISSINDNGGFGLYNEYCKECFAPSKNRFDIFMLSSFSSSADQLRAICYVNKRKCISFSRIIFCRRCYSLRTSVMNNVFRVAKYFWRLLYRSIYKRSSDLASDIIEGVLCVSALCWHFLAKNGVYS